MKFLVLEWEDGDLGEFFGTSFSNTVDNPNFIFKLDTPELQARDNLISDNGQSYFRCFVNERKLVEAGLSGLSLECIYFLHFNLWTSLFLFQYFSFLVSAADALNAISEKGDVSTRTMIKKAKESKSHLPPKVPDFLNHRFGSGKKRVNASYGSSKTHFKPLWGLCTQDSVLGVLSLP